MKIAAIADLHCRSDNGKEIQALLQGVQADADLLVVAGDLTDNGRLDEAEVALKELRNISLPVIAVLGNHDHESGQAEEIANLLVDGGITLLEGTGCEVDGIGFVGIKGFCGGYGSWTVQPFGENILKDFIMTGINEAMTLENAVAKLNCPHRVAVLHYSPIKETLEGESPELFAFLGSERLANALDRQKVDVIFHGHAHNGSPTGQTSASIPVYNVSRFVLARKMEKPYCVYEIQD